MLVFCVWSIRHVDDQDDMSSEASFYDDGNTSRIRRRRRSNSNIRSTTSDSSSSSESGSGGGSSDSDGSSEEEEEERGDGGHGGEGYRDKPGSMIMMARQEAPKFTVGGGNSIGARGHDEVCRQ